MSLAAGTRLGPYEIQSAIGAGGMGEVYEARDTRLDRAVALKILPREVAADPCRRARFEREARALAAIEHPNIVAVHSIEDVDGVHVITMELVRGEPLSAILSKGALAAKRLLNLAVQLADALAAAHLQGVVHRDVKPANVMVTDGDRVKVLDFGLARLKESTVGEADTLEAATVTEITGPQILGTLPYMAPEQLEGRPAGSRSDVFSLGIVLHEMATGRRPFAGDSSAALCSAILRDPAPPLARVRPDVPADLERIVRRALEKEPVRRYQTATDLRNDLEELQTRVISRQLPDAEQHPSTPRAASRLWRWGATSVVVLLIAAIAGYLSTRPRTKPTPVRRSIVVLPFDNLGPSEDEYFASGLSEEITGRLAVIGGLQVKSSATARQYDRQGKGSQLIGKELGVAYILRGSVQWARNAGRQGRVRITPHLVRASDDFDVWARTFDRETTDVFELQSDIAAAVVASLGVVLQGRERDALAAAPTTNHEAYLEYLRGRYYAAQPHYGRDTWREAMDAYQRAVDLDPGFALAWAHLCRAHARWYYLREDLSEERVNLARQALARAEALAPDSPEVHLAAGFYHLWAERNGDRALEDFERAGRELPDSAEVATAKAELLRVRGRYLEALEAYRHAFDLSPLDADVAEEIAITSWLLRRYPEALEYSNRAIALAPNEGWTYLGKVFNYWSWKGITKETREALGFVSNQHEWWLWAWFWQDAGEGRYREALQRLDAYPEAWVRQKMWAAPKSLFAGFAYDFLGEKELARAEFDRARRALEAALRTQPDDPRYHSSLGIADAALGLKNEAIIHGRRATELLPVKKDALYGIGHQYDLAVIYTLVGDEEAALREIERLLSMPSWMSPAWLRTNPQWRSLQNNPRFKALLAKYEST